MRYKAFISYRHLEPDKSVAKRLQKLLEGMKQPKGTEQWRIFRDESELPTSSNLSDDIEAALKESEYLIVICSPKLGQSIWCRQEIETFKNLHGGSTANIFTVLVEGAPDESFPDELCVSRKKIEKNGQVSYEDEKVEPLAANVVAKTASERNKLLQTEYLRIAAPMMGVTYDSLFDRKKREKIKKTATIAGSVAAVVTVASVGFGIYSSAMNAQITQQNNQITEQNNQISAQLETIKIENAKNYNIQSRNYADNHSIRDAVDTVLKSYEINDDHEAVVYDSDILLSNEIGTYEKNTHFPEYRLEHDENVLGLWLMADGKRLVTVDNSDHAYIWDPKTGECLWKSEDKISKDRMIINIPRKLLHTAGVNSIANTFSVEVQSDRIQQTGFERMDPSIEDVEADNYFYYTYYDLDKSCSFAKKVDLTECKVVEEEIDVESLSEKQDEYVDFESVLGNYRTIDLGDYILVEQQDGLLVNLEKTIITLKDKVSKESLWSNTIDIYGTMVLEAGILKKEDLIDAGIDTKTDVIFYVYANKIDFFAVDTGEKVASKIFEDGIIDYIYTKKGGFFVTLEDGRTELLILARIDSKSIILLEENMPKMAMHAYARGTEVVGYAKSKYVDIYSLVENDGYTLIVDEECTDENNYANRIQKIYTINEGEDVVVVTKCKIYKYNIFTKKITIIDEISDYCAREYGVSTTWEEADYEDAYLVGNKLWVYKRKNNLDDEWEKIRVYDVDTCEMLGKIADVPSKVPAKSDYVLRIFSSYENNETGFYYYNESEEEKIILDKYGTYIDKLYPSDDGEVVAYLSREPGETEQRLNIYEKESGINRQVTDGIDRIASELSVSFRADDRMMGYIDSKNPEGFYLVDVENAVQNFVEIPGKIIEGIYLAEGKIYLFGSLADTYVYDYDGNPIGSTNMSKYAERFHAATSDIKEIGDNTLMIREDSSDSIYVQNNGGGSIYLIDMTTDEVKQIFPCNTYDPVNNKVYGIKSGQLFSFPVITGSALYDKAKSMMHLK